MKQLLSDRRLISIQANSKHDFPLISVYLLMLFRLVCNAEPEGWYKLVFNKGLIYLILIVIFVGSAPLLV